MRIAEIYRSRQGEGLLTGTDSVFVRASGCNLRCWFCDTPYTSWAPEGDDLSVAEIMAAVRGYPAQHVVITGGEPMLFAEMLPLTQELRSARLHITIETAGTLFLPVSCDLMSISPKLANSTPTTERDPHWSQRHAAARHVPEVVHRLLQGYPFQLKFVVDQPADLAEIVEYLDEFPEAQADRILLMPQGVDPIELAAKQLWMEPFCQKHGFRFCPRKHIEWYGAKRGT